MRRMTEYKRKPSDLVMVDLCSGLGGASEWMYRRLWKVYRYDNDEQFKNIPETNIVDIMELERDDFPEHVDFVWSSPPCRAFSIAACSRHWFPYEEGGGPRSDLARESIELVAHVEKLVKEINPTFHLMENPRGMMRKKIRMPDYSFPQACFGTVGQKYTDFWGNLPWEFVVPRVFKWEPAPRGSKTGTQGIPKGPLRSLIPFALSKALGESIELHFDIITTDYNKEWWIYNAE